MNINEFKKLSTIKPKNDPNAWMDEPIKAQIWQNVNFTKDGKSYMGVMIYSSEMDAFKGYEFSLREYKEGRASYLRMACGNIIPWGIISHVLQIPVKP